MVAMTRRLLDALPPTNSFKRNFGKWESEILPVGSGDAGLYDLLLHSQDRCFDVPELYALAAAEGLQLAGFPMNAERYDPCTFVSNPEVRQRLLALPLPQRQALAEKICCTMRTHEFYLSRHPDSVASIDDPSNALLLFRSLFGRHRWLADRLQPGVPFTHEDAIQTLSITGTEITKRLIARMDGNTPIGRMYDEVVQTVPGATRENAHHELQRLATFLNRAGYLYLLEPGSHATKLPDYRRSEYQG
jgi:hypothetical protein